MFGLLLVDDLDRESNAGSRAVQRDAQQAARRDAIGAQIGLGLALLGAATGITLLVLDHDAEIEASTNGAGMVIRF